MQDLYFKKALKPQIYAYTTPLYKETEWRGEKTGRGLLKVGYTERDVIERIWQQFPTQTPEKQPFEVLVSEDAIDEKGKFFTDYISKRAVKSLIQTSTNRIEGYIYVRPNERVSDELNRSDTFLAITDAILFSLSGEQLYTCPFLVLNREKVIWLMPIEESSADAQVDAADFDDQGE